MTVTFPNANIASLIESLWPTAKMAQISLVIEILQEQNIGESDAEEMLKHHRKRSEFIEPFAIHAELLRRRPKADPTEGTVRMIREWRRQSRELEQHENKIRHQFAGLAGEIGSQGIASLQEQIALTAEWPSLGEIYKRMPITSPRIMELLIERHLKNGKKQ